MIIQQEVATNKQIVNHGRNNSNKSHGIDCWHNWESTSRKKSTKMLVLHNKLFSSTCVEWMEQPFSVLMLRLYEETTLKRAVRRKHF